MCTTHKTRITHEIMCQCVPSVSYHVSFWCILLQALAEKNAAIAESERCQRKLGLANRLIAALASEGDRWALTVQQLRKDYLVSWHDLKCFACIIACLKFTAAVSLFAL